MSFNQAIYLDVRSYAPIYVVPHNNQHWLASGRYWLEKLFKELVFVSAFHQSPPGLMAVFRSLYQEKMYLPIASSLEYLLFYRLGGKEWDQRKSLTSLLTHYQFSLQMSK